jgi:hypothetical protein
VSKQLHIFATRSDLVTGLEQFEKENPVRYALSGLNDGPLFQCYESLLEWSDLGKNATGDHISGPTFLVVSKDTEIRTEQVQQLDGSVRYALSQKLNPESITFSPGGLFGDRTIVCGHTGTIWKTQQSLYDRFAGLIAKGFARIGSYRIGPEAERLMDSGYRMVTLSINSPKIYDLRRS